MGQVMRSILKIRDVLSKWNVYVLESMRIVTLVNSALILDVWRSKYHLSFGTVVIIGVLFLIFNIWFGWFLITKFKAAGYEILYDQIPQVKNTYDGTIRIEQKIDRLEKKIEELQNALQRK